MASLKRSATRRRRRGGTRRRATIASAIYCRDVLRRPPALSALAMSCRRPPSLSVLVTSCRNPPVVTSCWRPPAMPTPPATSCRRPLATPTPATSFGSVRADGVTSFFFEFQNWTTHGFSYLTMCKVLLCLQLSVANRMLMCKVLLCLQLSVTNRMQSYMYRICFSIYRPCVMV
jgi:hypothetical protein